MDILQMSCIRMRRGYLRMTLNQEVQLMFRLFITIKMSFAELRNMWNNQILTL